MAIYPTRARKFFLRDVTFERDVVPGGRPEADLFYLRMHPAGRHVDGQIASLTVADFASAIAAMTPLGDTGETFAAAVRFLETGEFADKALHDTA